MAGTRGGWSVFAREGSGWEQPEAAPSQCCPWASCCTDGETEAQRGDSLVQDTERVRQNQGWHVGLLPCTQMSAVPPGTVPKHRPLWGS